MQHTFRTEPRRWLAVLVLVGCLLIVGASACCSGTCGNGQCQGECQLPQVCVGNGCSSGCKYNGPRRIGDLPDRGADGQKKARVGDPGGGGKCKKCCFPARSAVQVQHPDGSIVPTRLDHLVLGDRVLTVETLDGIPKFEPVLFWLHRVRNSSSLFITLQTEAGPELWLSHDHLVFVADGPLSHFEDAAAVSAASVKSGQYVFIPSGNPVGNEAKLDVPVSIAVPTRVRSTAQHTSPGKYTPVTRSGTIVVDGVVASCYAAFKSHNVAHVLLYPWRAAARWQQFWASGPRDLAAMDAQMEDVFPPMEQVVDWLPSMFFDYDSASDSRVLVG